MERRPDAARQRYNDDGPCQIGPQHRQEEELTCPIHTGALGKIALQVPFWQEIREVRQQFYARYFELGDKLAEPILESEPENGPVFVLHIVFRECKQRALTST